MKSPKRPLLVVNKSGSSCRGVKRGDAVCVPPGKRVHTSWVGEEEYTLLRGSVPTT